MGRSWRLVDPLHAQRLIRFMLMLSGSSASFSAAHPLHAFKQKAATLPTKSCIFLVSECFVFFGAPLNSDTPHNMSKLS